MRQLDNLKQRLDFLWFLLPACATQPKDASFAHRQYGTWRHFSGFSSFFPWCSWPFVVHPGTPRYSPRFGPGWLCSAGVVFIPAHLGGGCSTSDTWSAGHGSPGPWTWNLDPVSPGQALLLRMLRWVWDKENKGLVRRDSSTKLYHVIMLYSLFEIWTGQWWWIVEIWGSFLSDKPQCSIILAEF